MNKRNDLSIAEMMQMQKDLHAVHEGKWEPLTKEYGRYSVLYMIEEIGEVIAIIKKKGDEAIVADPLVREVFLEELSDVLMYFNDTLIRYGIQPEEMKKAYVKKHLRNKGRQYSEEYAHLFEGEES